MSTIFLVRNDYFSSYSVKKWLILYSGIKQILVLENINKYGRNVFTAKSKSILTILHWI